MKLPFPRSFKAWLVASVSLVAVTVVSIAPVTRPRAQSSPPSYTFTDLGTLGGSYSKAYGINNCGQVVGDSSLTGASPARPFIWRDGVMRDLGTLGGMRGLAMDINASGLVVGLSTIATSEQQHAFRWFDLDGDGVSDPGELNDLGVIPGYSTHGAFGVNDNGQIVGSAETGDGVASGFIWNANTGLQLLATLNGITPSHGQAINNSSHIAGYAASNDHAFIFDGTTNMDLGTLGGPRSVAFDINAAGHAVGFADVNPTGSSSHAFKWNGSAPPQDLGVLPGGVYSQANSINSSGVVVGFSKVTGDVFHAFVHDGTLLDLNAPGVVTGLPVGWTLSEARGINDGGQIVGHGTTPGGETHAFLLTPTTFAPGCSPTVTVTVSPASVSEDGATNLTYTFRRSPVTSTPMTVNFLTSGDATRAVDYAVSGTGITYDPNTGSGTVAFAAGEITKNVTVDPTTDADIEANETVILTTTSGTGYIVGLPSSTTGTINNDDSIPSVSVSVAPLTAAEDAATSLVYTFTRSTTPGSPLTVSFATTGTASGGDYAISSVGAVTIPAGSPSATVTVTPIADPTDESDETVILTITPDAAYTVAAAPQNSAEGKITDDDGTPTIQITNVSAPEPNSGASALFTFTVSLTNPSSSQITVSYATATTGATTPATSGAGCNAGIDFVDASGGLTFLAGETSKQVSVNVCGDNSLEPDEIFFVNLSSNSANSILPANTKGIGTITPQAPIVFTEEGNVPFAVAVDSVTFARGPFKLTNNTNFSSDRLTRVILVTSNLRMTQADLATGILTVNIAGYGNPLPIEHVGTITGVVGLDASFIIVRLPAELQELNPAPGPNNLTLTVKMGSATSNATLLSITP